MPFGLISIVLLAPLAGAVALFFVPKDAKNALRAIAFGSIAASFGAAITAFFRYDRAAGGYQFVDKFDWVPQMGVSYHVGVDGINLLLLVLTAFCSLAGIYVACQVKDRLKEFLIFYLFLCVGCFGVLSCLNIFFMYFFYECAVIPVFPLIGAWGSGDKDYASMKLTLYLTLGAVLALLAIIALYWQTGLNTFDFVVIEAALRTNPLPVSFQTWAFPLIMAGFGVILTLWPMHTWSPLGYAAAPTSVSMLHAGVLKKLGAYMIIRLAITLMPAGAQMWMPYVAGIAAINIVYCGLVAFTQKDLKYILGYSSCSHMGLILLGLATLTPSGLNGTVLYMFAHGIMAALSFALVGFVYEQTHKRNLEDWGGLGRKIPYISTLFVMAAMASAGVPGFAPFMGELMVLLGAWDKYPIPTLAAVAGLVITAGYMLKMVRHTIQGPLNPACADVQDAKGLAKLPYGILMAVLILVGFLPNLLLSVAEPSTAKILSVYPKETVKKVVPAASKTSAAHKPAAAHKAGH
jgi:NADH-quinone oxidoreductase subunit M